MPHKTPKTPADPATWQPATHAVRGGLERGPHGETSEAIFLNSGYTYDSAEIAEGRFTGEIPGHVYSRYSNPNLSLFETRMALLEGAEAARATGSGMAAVTASLLALVRAGDHVVAARALFGSCRWVIEHFLPRFGVATALVDGADPEAWRAAIRPNTRAFFLETPANPTLAIVDVRTVAAIAREAGAKLIVDNVFATPIFQKPLTLGADIVVYSATKHIDGQGRVLGGVICGSQAFIDGDLKDICRHTGPALSPFSAWILAKGLETLDLRIRRQSETAALLADLLAGSPGIARVFYPGRADHPGHAIAKAQMSGFSNLVAFRMAGGKDAAFAFLNALGIVDISNNLGDSRSLATHPATTTHRTMSPEARAEIGVSDDLIRLSVGLEDAADLAADLRYALGVVGDEAETRSTNTHPPVTTA